MARKTIRANGIRILPARKWQIRDGLWGERAIHEMYLNVGKKKLTQIKRLNAGNGTQQRASSFAIASALRNPQTKRILENDINTVIDIAEKQRNKGLRRSVTHNAQRIRANRQKGKEVGLHLFNVFEVPIHQRLQFTSRIASRRKKISPISYSILDPRPVFDSKKRNLNVSTSVVPTFDMDFPDKYKYSVPESRNLYANADLSSDYLSPKQDKMDLKNRRRQTLAWDAFYLEPDSKTVRRIYDKGYDHDAYKTRRNRTNKPVKLTQVKGQRKSDIMMYGTEDKLQQAKYIQAQKDVLQDIVNSKEFSEHQKTSEKSKKTFNENIANRKPSTVTTDLLFDFLTSEMDRKGYRIGIPKNRYERTQREVADLYMQPYNAMRDRLFSTHPDVQRQSQLIAEEIARQDAKSAKKQRSNFVTQKRKV